ncbi:uncharacterized protein LOC119084526 [Bradysia coprophila]|uniref:uncharacterized protein LOC119084526 n=1 Tax=Bradysia coprophila TaxID=38358 RepID=UPI00187DA708|nr:uncharacterized protein LOC119084526 [Bradysia coprophila]
MRCGLIVVILIGILAYMTFAEETVEPEQCNGPPPLDRQSNPDKCCKKPVFKPNVQGCLKKTREILMKRYHEAREGPKEDQADSTVVGDDVCMANCLTNNEIFQNDEINRDELIKALESQSEDSAWASIHSDAVDKCIEVLQSDFKNIQPSKSGRRCNRASVLMMICLNGQYVVKCPETNFQNDDENCKKLQEHIKTCPMPRLGPWGHGNGRKGRKERSINMPLVQVHGYQ